MPHKNSFLKNSIHCPTDELALYLDTMQQLIELLQVKLGEPSLQEQKLRTTAQVCEEINHTLTKLQIVKTKLCKQNRTLLQKVKKYRTELNKFKQKFKQKTSERYLTEVALKEQQHLLRNIIDASPSLIFIKDREGKFILANQAIADIYQTTVKDITGKTDADFNPNPIEVAQYCAADQEVIASLKTKVISEETVSSPTGKFSYFRTIKKPVLSSNGQITHVVGVAIDITERKRVETALKESEERFRTMANTAPVMIWVSDTDGLYNFFNKSWLDFTGRTLEQELDKGWTANIHPEDFQSYLDSYLLASNARQSFRIECRLRRFDGEYRWILDNGVPRVDTNGNFAGYIGSCIDITDQKITETALKEAKQQLQAVLDAVPGCVSWLDANGRYQGVNRYLANVYKLPPEAFVGQEISFPKNIPSLIKFVSEFLRSLEQKASQVIVTEGNGLKRYFLFVVQKYNQGANAVTVGIDITERKEAEEALSKSEARNRELINAIPDLMIRMTKDGTYLDFIPAKDFQFIMPHKDMRGKNINAIMPPEIAQERLYYTKKALATGKTQVYEFQLQQNDQQFQQEARIVASGVDEVLVIIRDISARKQAELALHKLNEKLEIRVEERTSQLKDTILQLQQEIAERQRIQDLNKLLASVVQQASDVIEITNAEAKFEYVNPSFEKVTGYKSDEVIGKTPASLLRSGKHSEAFYEQIWDTISSFQVWHGNISGKRKDGSIYDQEATIYPVTNQNSVITHYVAVKRDITERKRTEAALNSSEERFRFLAESLPQQVWIANISGALTYVNQRVLNYFNCSLGEVLNSGWQNKVHPEDLASCLASWQYSLDTGETYEVRFRLHRVTDATYRWHLARALPWRDRNGNILSWFGTNTDIDDYHQAEAALRKSQEQLQAILDNSPTVISLKDTQNRYLLINHMYEKLFGMNSENTIGKNLYDFWPLEIANALAANDQKVLTRGESIKVEEYMPHKDGIHTYISHKFPLYNSDGVPYAVCNISTDITDRKQVEVALKESEEKFRRIFEDAPIGMVLITLNTHKNIKLNPAFCQMLGYTESELQELNFHEFTHPEDLEKEIPLIQQCIDDKITSYQIEKRYIKKNNEIVWVNLTAGLIQDANGNLGYALYMVEDITKRKQAEIALQQAKDRLEAVLDAVPGFVCWINSELEYLGVNENFADTFNLLPNILLNKKWDFIENQLPFNNFVYHFFKSSDLAVNQVVDIQVNDYIHNYLVVAQKYNQGNAVFVGIDITTRQQAQLQIKTSLQEKEVLLKEIHHRVKNNLQVICSLLKLQSTYISDEKMLATFNDSYNRIRSMALIHEKLYQSQDLGKIDAAEYIPLLATNLLRSYDIDSQAINLTLEVAHIFLDVDTAVPCGLIINELVSNTLKYAFKGLIAGEILISFKQGKNNKICLIVKDNGVGLPANFDFRQTESLGLQLVCNLTEQLNGEIELKPSNGTCYHIQFNL